MGRVSRGVRGIRLSGDQKVISLIVAAEGHVLTATENGYGKRTPMSEYPRHGRGGQGVISIQTSERNGKVVGAVLVEESNEIMLITNAGTLVRTRAAEVSITSRNTQGVKLISLGAEEKLTGLDSIAENGDDEEEEEGNHGEHGEE